MGAGLQFVAPSCVQSGYDGDCFKRSRYRRWDTDRPEPDGQQYARAFREGNHFRPDYL